MADDFAEVLDSYSMKTLQQIADATGIATKGTTGPYRKATLIKRMQRLLKEEKRIRASWKKLSRNEQDMLAFLIGRDEWIDTLAFRQLVVMMGLAEPPPETHERKWDRERPPYAQTDYYGDPSQEPRTVFDDMVANLTLHGLVFSQVLDEPWRDSSGKMRLHPGHFVFVPHEIQSHLDRPQIDLSSLTRKEEPPMVVPGAPERFARDLYLYWDHVRRQGVRLLKNGAVGKRGLRALNAALLRKDPHLDTAKTERDAHWLHLLRLLLTSLGLVRQGASQLVATPQPEGVPQIWTQPETDLLASLLGHWPSIDVQSPAKASNLAPFVQLDFARGALGSTLSILPIGQWIPLDSVLIITLLNSPTFLVDRASASPFMVYQYDDIVRRVGGYKGIDAIHRDFVRQELVETLGPMGVADLGYRGPEPVAVRITPLGHQALAQLMAEHDVPVPPQQPPADLSAVADHARLVLQPNYAILAMGPVPLSTLAQLDLIAERQRTDVTVFEYTLTKESVYRAQQAGMTATEIITLLEAQADTALPQNVRRSVMEWGAQHERIVFRKGVSLAQADPELLSLLLEGTNEGALFERAITPSVAQVTPGANEILVQALIARGILPASVSEAREAVEDSLVIEADGAVHPLQRRPSLPVVGKLNQWAEPGANGAWRLTEASVGRVASDRETTQALLDDLTRLARDPLPDELMTRVKAWGHYYGEATSSTLTLIEFRDRETLDELLAHPRLKRRLKRFRAGERALATVESRWVDEVQEVLAELGVVM